MQLSSALQVLLSTLALASAIHAYPVNDTGNAAPAPASPPHYLAERSGAPVPFLGVAEPVTTPENGQFSTKQIKAAGSDAATRLRDRRFVPNPAKGANDRNPFPHPFRHEALAWIDNRCGQAQLSGQLYEYPIQQGGLVRYPFCWLGPFVLRLLYFIVRSAVPINRPRSGFLHL